MKPALISRRRLSRTFAAWLALALGLSLLANCGGVSGQDAAAKKMAAVLNKELKQMAAAVRRPLEKKDAAAVQQALAAVLKQWQAQGLQEEFWVAVLDKKGVVLSLLRYGPDSGPAPGSKQAGELNLGRFQAVVRALKESVTSQQVLYLPPHSPYGDKVFAAVAPVGQGPEVYGAVCRLVLQETLAKAGVSEKQFLGMNLD